MQTMPSKAAQILVTVIPIVGIIMGSIVIFFYFLWYHKQKRMMIEKGLYTKKTFDIDSFSLFAGILLFSVGFSLILFFHIKEGFSYGILGGLIPLSTGVGLMLFFIIRLLLKKNAK